jgi:hypothetical protein
MNSAIMTCCAPRSCCAACRVVARKVCPGRRGDSDVSLLQEWLQRNDLRGIGKDVVHQAADQWAAPSQRCARRRLSSDRNLRSAWTPFVTARLSGAFWQLIRLRMRTTPDPLAPDRRPRSALDILERLSRLAAKMGVNAPTDKGRRNLRLVPLRPHSLLGPLQLRSSDFTTPKNFGITSGRIISDCSWFVSYQGQLSPGRGRHELV